MSGDDRETLSKAAQSRGENMMINRACEIFVDARKAIGGDLQGSSLVDLIADNSGYPLDACRELASIVVERCECSQRLREKYAEAETVINSEHHFAVEDRGGLSMRMVECVGNGGRKRFMIIERHIVDDALSAGVERLVLNRDEAHHLDEYLRFAESKFWRE